MRRLFLSLFAFWAFLDCQGQCNLDFSFEEEATQFNLLSLPDTGQCFSPACLNFPYHDVWHFECPTVLSQFDSAWAAFPFDSAHVVGNGITLIDTVTNELFLPEEIGLTFQYDNSIFLGGQQKCAAIQGIPDRAGFYNISIEWQVWSTIIVVLPLAQSFRFCLEVIDNDCQTGCTNSSACNYNVNATEDDGSCQYWDECGICGGGGIPTGDCDCSGNQPDAIGVCGGNCLEDDDNNGVCDNAEIFGCTYSFSPNYDPDATMDDGSCESPCSSLACGLQYDGNADGAVGSGDLLGLLTEFGAVCEPTVAFACGDPVSYQGYDYATVLIGEQCWFAENLRSENYENGDAIPSNLSDSQWTSTTSGATAVYGDSSSNLETYGRLYNWYAVDDARGLCPSGWHVPTDGEWTVMTDFLGGASVAGGQMKTTYGWNGGEGTNLSGFSGLPGGVRGDFSGSFCCAGYDGSWWSSTQSNSGALDRSLFEDGGDVLFPDDSNPRYGYSIRCIKDTE